MNLPRIGMLAALAAMTGCDIDIDHDGDQNKFTEEFSQDHAMVPGGRLTLENQNGAVEIAGWNQDRVEIRATKYAATKDDLRALKIDVRMDTGLCEVRTVRPAAWERRNRGGIRYRIHVPNKTRLDRVSSTNGEVRAESIQGDINMRSTNGSVRLFQVAGDADLHTTNGRVELREFKGAATLETTNGQISAEGVKGRLTASTTNGGIDISAEELDPASANRLRTTNGHVNLTLASAKVGGVEIGTTNGGVKLRMPATVSARLRASTTNSNIATNFPVEHLMDNKRRRLDATLGSGGPVVDVHTTNGGIRIEKN